MSREKEGYRDALEYIKQWSVEEYGEEKRRFTAKMLADYDGCHEKTARRRYGLKAGELLNITDFARILNNRGAR